MKKKILSLCLVIALAATAVIGGTLAYFTDTEQKTNVMTIGNVEINIEELAKNPETGAYEKYEDGNLTLYPREYDEGAASFNKMVYTFNTSDSKDDAYIRTFVLIEANDKLVGTDYVPNTDCCPPGIHHAYSKADYTFQGKQIQGAKASEIGIVEVGEEKYHAILFTDLNDAAIPYDNALEAINALWIREDVTSEQIAGWGEDGKIDVIVFSQGIQTDGMANAAEAYKALNGGTDEVTVDYIESLIKNDDATINDWFNK